MFNYANVLIRNVSPSFTNAICNTKPTIPIDINKAIHQHKIYTNNIKSLINTCHIIDYDDTCPDCVFIEDICVIIGNKVLITNPGHIARKNEIRMVKDYLVNLGLDILYMPSDCTLDGGDVLITNKEIFVGISSRTNIKGGNFIKNVFDDKKVSFINVTSLHLKSSVSILDNNSLIITDTTEGENIARQIADYEFTKIPDSVCSNILRIHNTVFIQKGYPKSEKILEKIIIKKGLICKKLEMSEFIKADGALTCCSVLF